MTTQQGTMSACFELTSHPVDDAVSKPFATSNLAVFEAFRKNVSLGEVLDGASAFLNRATSAAGGERSRLEAVLREFRAGPGGGAGAPKGTA
jgi:hypothetical protein